MASPKPSHHTSSTHLHHSLSVTSSLNHLLLCTIQITYCCCLVYNSHCSKWAPCIALR
ncbi:hypothetical protein Hanom_Chr16g01521421 [Helianthus anomalus]